jgi:hypothetical protein
LIEHTLSQEHGHEMEVVMAVQRSDGSLKAQWIPNPQTGEIVAGAESWSRPTGKGPWLPLDARGNVIAKVPATQNQAGGGPVADAGRAIASLFGQGLTSALGAQGLVLNDYANPLKGMAQGAWGIGTGYAGAGSGLAQEFERRGAGQQSLYEDTFRNALRDYGTAARFGEPTGLAAERAGAGVQQQLNAAQSDIQANLARRGIHPGSPEYNRAMTQLSIQGALGKAGAMNQAADQARVQNFQKLGGAAQMGTNLAGQASQISALATPIYGEAAQMMGLGTQGVGQAGQLGLGAVGIPADWYKAGLQAYTNIMGNEVERLKAEGSEGAGFGGLIPVVGNLLG